MSGPILALRAAIRERLLADADLLARLGGPRVVDRAPRGLPPPFLWLAEADTRDWGSGDVRGHEHRLALVALSREGGPAEALAIAERAATLLDDAELDLAGHRLVLLRVVATELRRGDGADTVRATLRLRALTEPA